VRSPSLHRSNHPARHVAGAEIFQRRAPDLGGASLALRDRDQQVAPPRHRDADRSAAGTVLHVGDADDMTGLARGKTFAHQIEVGDAIDLVVIGNAGVAVAKAFLGPPQAPAPQRKARPAGQPSRGNGQAISCQSPARGAARSYAAPPDTFGERGPFPGRLLSFASRRAERNALFK